MSNQTTTLRLPPARPGLKWALGIVTFLAIVGTIVALKAPTADVLGTRVATIVDTPLSDYGLRHPAQQSAEAQSTEPGLTSRPLSDDYGLRHMPDRSNPGVDSYVHDYGLRHLSKRSVALSNSPDYALRHVAD